MKSYEEDKYIKEKETRKDNDLVLGLESKVKEMFREEREVLSFNYM